MSGIKPLALTEFYRSLHARRDAEGRAMSTDALAAKLNVAPSVVRKLIGLLKRRQGRVWEGLCELLTERERALLRDVEQCSAWNMRRAMQNRPRWTEEKVAGLAETYRGGFDEARDRLRAPVRQAQGSVAALEVVA